MDRTTPPRPIDVAAVFPELAPLARTATRLHPRPGSPGVGDSSVGGPLLWPVGEPWPVCGRRHDMYGDLERTRDVRERRRILGDAWGRTPVGGRFAITAREQEELDRLEAAAPPERPDGPITMLPVAQLFCRDVPDLVAPPGMDLLQVLWCPFDHDDEDDLGSPSPLLRWRRASDVGEVLDPQPEPEVMEYDTYLPEPCVLHPEQVVEYPYIDLLPGDLGPRMREWEQESGHAYHYELSIADGWKVGGYASWNLTDPYPMVCACGTDMELLLRIASSEWDGGASWRPVEDAAGPTHHSLPAFGEPTEVTISRGYSLWIFICPASFDHPRKLTVQ
ncbi:hypothetical protein [Actinomadura chibensis]|uniref:DUF1963 domain-containing protein n=1 Tax=Actinomadura chibensis TaxID=392828 RepID=A0A5D0NUZ5_9ACTN|nr:hypothetical protein [Actinomadura chibensis]TYB48326.1 hypothetical protein FXF69_03720 [Actinomadura chibensis]